MGKYMRKAKITSDVAVELSQSSIGVLTRAKTLALQRLQATTNPPDESSLYYLQLRNRRLEKPNDTFKQQKSTSKESCRQNPEPNLYPRNPKPRTSSRLRLSSVKSAPVGSDSISCSKKERGCFGESTLVASKEEAEDYNDLGIEASFGENNLEFEGRERSTRESTPCSLVRGSESDTIGTPGSSTRPTSLMASNRRSQNSMQQDIPTTHEMEEFFAFAEQQQRRLFTEKYNFDVVNDMPLPGRYEWARVCP